MFAKTALVNRKILLTVFFLFSFLFFSSFKAKSNDISHLFKVNVPQWMLEQIQADLAPFTKADLSKENLDQIMLKEEILGNHFNLVRYKIIDNKIFVLTQSNHSRISHVTTALKKLAKKTTLPKVDLIISMQDSIDGQEHKGPIFSFAKDPKNAPEIILIPDCDALSGNWELLESIEKANHTYPWYSKINQAIWRGAMTGGIYTPENFLDFPRTNTITLSLKFPHLVNARFNQITQCTDPDAIKRRFSEYFSSSLPTPDHIKYKYQLLIDGNTCTYPRAIWQLFSNSVVLKQSSDAVQWFYGALKPYEHYLPVNSDMSNLIDVIQWAINHDDEALAISHRAQEFAKDNLTQFRVMQYLYLLLTEYAKLQNK